MRWPAFCVGWCSALVAVLRCPVAPLRCLVFCAGCPAGCFPMEFCSNAPASNNSVRVPPASSIFPIALRCSAPASNKPHSAEKSTPVWLAIWRIWAGFANSQLLPDAAALYSIQGPQRKRQLFRTDFRFAPSPRRASLAVPPIHEGHGRPRSVRKSSRLRWKCLSMD